MTLQVSGPISLGNVSTELGIASNSLRSLGSSTTRALLGVPSGAISLSNARGKSNLTPLTTFYQNVAASYSYQLTLGGDFNKNGQPFYVPPGEVFPGYPAHGGRGGVNVFINGNPTGNFLGQANWQPFVYTVDNSLNGRPQTVRFTAYWSCGVWDSSSIFLYATSPSQILQGQMSSGHVPDYSIYYFNFVQNVTIPANSIYTFQYYQAWDPNGDYTYNNHASTLNSVLIEHVGFV
jgi:hypothetical protein